MIEPENDLITSEGAPRDGVPLGVLLTAQARATPDAPAVTFDGHTLSFAELEARANRRARHLEHGASVTAGDRVVISLPNGHEYFEASFAIWKLGAVPCPISYRIAEAEFRDLVALIDPRCIIAGQQTPASGFPSLRGDLDPPDKFSADPLAPVVASPCKIMNSGGSTGRPKLIIDPEPSAWGPDKQGRRREPRTSVLMPAPLHHSAPFAYTTMALLEGSHIIVAARFDPEEWLRLVEQHHPRFAYLVPTMMSRIAKLPQAVTAAANLSSLETLTHTAAPCPPETKRWWIERVGARTVLEIYGGTERIGATVIDGREWLDRPGSVGRAVPGDEIIILGEDGKPLPPGQIGEIYFRKARGPGTAYAYIGSETRIRGELDSFGDMGWVDGDGFLYIADRRTDMVTIGGANVFPAEVEAALEQLPGVLCAAVIGLPDNDMGNRLHAIIEMATNTPIPADGLDFVSPAMARLSPLKRPRSVEFTRERIRDDSGKVRRSRLRAERLKGQPRT